MIPSLSTDQVAAFVELARQGDLRRASRLLHVTEQGVRNRLLALEARLGVELYRKARGPRRTQPLTDKGRLFLPHALAFLDRARPLGEAVTAPAGPQATHGVATPSHLLHVHIHAVRNFHQAFPDVRVRLSNHTEQEIEEALLRDPEVALGVAAPYEPSPQLEYSHLFSMDWSLVTPPRH